MVRLLFTSVILLSGHFIYSQDVGDTYYAISYDKIETFDYTVPETPVVYGENAISGTIFFSISKKDHLIIVENDTAKRFECSYESSDHQCKARNAVFETNDGRRFALDVSPDTVTLGSVEQISQDENARHFRQSIYNLTKADLDFKKKEECALPVPTK